MRGDSRRYCRNAHDRADGEIDSACGDDEHHAERYEARFGERLREELPIQRRPEVAAAIAGVNAEKKHQQDDDTGLETSRFAQLHHPFALGEFRRGVSELFLRGRCGRSHGEGLCRRISFRPGRGALLRITPMSTMAPVAMFCQNVATCRRTSACCKEQSSKTPRNVPSRLPRPPRISAPPRTTAAITVSS